MRENTSNLYSSHRARPHDDFIRDLEWLTRGVRALRILYQLRKEQEMSRLLEKLTAAAAVAPRLEAKLEARADAIIARETGLEEKGDRAFARHDQRLDDASAAVDLVDAALSVLTNGGPPLEPSSPVSPQPGPAASTEPADSGDATTRDVFNG